MFKDKNHHLSTFIQVIGILCVIAAFYPIWTTNAYFTIDFLDPNIEKNYNFFYEFLIVSTLLFLALGKKSYTKSYTSSALIGALIGLSASFVIEFIEIYSPEPHILISVGMGLTEAFSRLGWLGGAIIGLLNRFVFLRKQKLHKNLNPSHNAKSLL